ncbi:hypothetical protein SAMN05421858_3509 [Haladaptatus litoreus]|uniref:Uncharacterized protein n=1 Tax=Haladaptatus litoreus TaxID=553468 RepID=A0A1N7DCC5_9EURY|nr:hypothetical protein SAMN05421858_3509 [Haladaptatus litoreus]
MWIVVIPLRVSEESNIWNFSALDLLLSNQFLIKNNNMKTTVLKWFTPIRYKPVLCVCKTTFGDKVDSN